MASSRTSKKSTGRSSRRAGTARPPSGGTTRGRGPRRSVQSLPGWRELEAADNSRKAPRGGWDAVLGAVPTFRVLLAILIAAGTVTLYVGHVYATQQLLDDVQLLRRENLSLHLRHNRVKGAVDQASGPSVIYDRAARLGLEPAAPNDPFIELPPTVTGRP